MADATQAKRLFVLKTWADGQFTRELFLFGFTSKLCFIWRVSVFGQDGFRWKGHY